ncbi:hypothetical protein KDL01_39970 [Actinospica durhamensis]|uniref:Uncharacterized protein n=1 Tax=Actinospica durhamensis TaxID=1508375 RepID=A0A941IUR4_9ACTN|nr:hypothetical protein [Actinospica durhamensis]MBR7839502.1 hypothetical protein [Actinospica durhamensis]
MVLDLAFPVVNGLVMVDRVSPVSGGRLMWIRASCRALPVVDGGVVV